MAPLVTAPLQPRAPRSLAGPLGLQAQHLLAGLPSPRGWLPRGPAARTLRDRGGQLGKRVGARCSGQTGGQEARAGRVRAPLPSLWRAQPCRGMAMWHCCPGGQEAAGWAAGGEGLESRCRAGGGAAAPAHRAICWGARLLSGAACPLPLGGAAGAPQRAQ